MHPKTPNKIVLPKEPIYPAPLMELFQALHIKPPCFATPETDMNITSTLPTSPIMHINHMALCTALNDLSCNRLRRAPPLIQLRRTLFLFSPSSFPLRFLFCLAPRAELYLSSIQCGILSVLSHHAPIRAFPLWLDV